MESIICFLNERVFLVSQSIYNIHLLVPGRARRRRSNYALLLFELFAVTNPFIQKVTHGWGVDTLGSRYPYKFEYREPSVKDSKNLALNTNAKKT